MESKLKEKVTLRWLIKKVYYDEWKKTLEGDIRLRDKKNLKEGCSLLFFLTQQNSFNNWFLFFSTKTCWVDIVKSELKAPSGDDTKTEAKTFICNCHSITHKNEQVRKKNKIFSLIYWPHNTTKRPNLQF